jgi:urease accessory protein
MQTILVQLSSDVVRQPTGSTTLTFHQREKSRQRIVLDDGREAALMLERGVRLRHGDVVTDAEGTERIRVCAADEVLSCARSADVRTLARACYHLGNRHVAVEVCVGAAYYLADHVLDDMVRGLGIEVMRVRRRFEPESGAYGGHHAHAH